MRQGPIIVAAFLAVEVFSTKIAMAEQKERSPLIQDDWKCGSPVELTPELVAFMSPEFISPASPESDGDKSRAFVAGTLKDPLGSRTAMLFVNGDDGWIAYPVQEQAGFSNAYVNSEAGRAILFSMIGPGKCCAGEPEGRAS